MCSMESCVNGALKAKTTTSHSRHAAHAAHVQSYTPGTICAVERDGVKYGVMPVWRVQFGACQFGACQFDVTHFGAIPLWRVPL